MVVYELLRTRGKSKFPRANVVRVIRDNILSLNKPSEVTDEEKIISYVMSCSAKFNEIDTKTIATALTNLNLKLSDSKPVAADTYRLRKQAFGAVLDHAYCNQYIKENPMKRVKMTRKMDATEIDPKTVLSPEKCRAI